MLPAWVEFELDGHDGPNFHCRIELRDDVPQLVELGWRAEEKQTEIRQKHLRATEVSSIVHSVYSTWVIELRDVWRDQEGEALRAFTGNEQDDRIIRNLLHDLRDGRRRVTAELLRQVA